MPVKLRSVPRRIGLRALPQSHSGDALYHWLCFVARYGRLPSKRAMRLNDVLYRLKTGPEIDLPLRRTVSDKELVKYYIRDKLGDEFNIPTLAVLRSAEDATKFSYPNDCVVKPTHLSGHVVFRRDGQLINCERITSWFGMNHYFTARERNYRNLTPKIIIEPFVFDSKIPDDYKVFCWHGEPKLIQVDLDRFGDHRRAYFDVNWTPQPFSFVYPRYSGLVPCPTRLPLMLDLARALSAEFSFIRVDFYVDGNRVVVGELTNCPEGGNGLFLPPEGEHIASRLIFGGD